MEDKDVNSVSGKSQAPGIEKTVLIAKIDQRALPALDRVADANQVSTSQMMVGFFTNITDSVNLLTSSPGESSDVCEERLARLIVERCPAANLGALQTAKRIWARAVEIKSSGRS